jgi:hypothetical protein
MSKEESKEFYHGFSEQLKNYFIVGFQFRISKDKDDNLFITEYFDDETNNMSSFLTDELIEDFMDLEMNETEDSFILDNCKNTGMYYVNILFEIDPADYEVNESGWLNPLHLEILSYCTNEELLKEEEEIDCLDELPFLLPSSSIF